MIKSLARELAINYYNMSVASANRDDHNNPNLTPGADIIFKSKLQPSEHGFTRNILITGAGASKNIYEFVKVANEVMNEVIEKVHLKDTIGVQAVNEVSQWQKFLDIVSEITNHRYSCRDHITDRENLFKIILKRLTFEDKNVIKPVGNAMSKTFEPVTNQMNNFTNELHKAESHYITNPINEIEQKVFLDPINKAMKEIHMAEQKFTVPIAEGFKKDKNGINH